MHELQWYILWKQVVRLVLKWHDKIATEGIKKASEIYGHTYGVEWRRNAGLDALEISQLKCAGCPTSSRSCLISGFQGYVEIIEEKVYFSGAAATTTRRWEV
jgi:hypothetical protein